MHYIIQNLRRQIDKYYIVPKWEFGYKNQN